MDEQLKRARPVLEEVASEEDLHLILSLIAADDGERWLRERLAYALRD